MKNRFLAAGILAIAAFFALGACCPKQSKNHCAAACVCGESPKQIYEWRIYTLTGEAMMLDEFFAKTLIPAYNRLDAQVGAFEPKDYAEGDPQQRYLMLVYPSMCSYLRAKHDIWKDEIFRAAAQPFFDTTKNEAAYSNFETVLCEAFDSMPQMRMPGRERGLFEFRYYRSPNEESNKRKISMFESGEVEIFDDAGINSVCYGEILAGPKQPALTYLTWYKDLDTRNAAWDKFRADPRWLEMKKDPKYARTATNNTSTLLLPLAYSQF